MSLSAAKLKPETCSFEVKRSSQGKTRTGLHLFLHSFSPLLKTGVMFACFKTDRNLEFLTDPLKLNRVTQRCI